MRGARPHGQHMCMSATRTRPATRLCYNTALWNGRFASQTTIIMLMITTLDASLGEALPTEELTTGHTNRPTHMPRAIIFLRAHHRPHGAAREDGGESCTGLILAESCALRMPDRP